MSDQPRVPADPKTVGLLAAWLAALVVGVGALWGFAETPGEGAEAPPQWPIASALAHERATPSLLVFVHSQCDCSRTTLSALEALLTEVRSVLAAQVIIEGPRIEGGIIASMARAIPGVVVVFDPDESEAHRFGVHTAGQVLLYDRLGALRFSGGITIGRARLAAPEGLQSLRALLDESTSEGPVLARADVFGCEARTEQP